MLSQTAEYALRAVVWLASNAATSLTTGQIAKATKVPEGYLSKVMQSLGRGGIVRAQRGKHGGFALAKPAAALTVLEVIQAVDPIQRIYRCPLNLASHGEHLCPLHRRMDDAMLSIERAFCGTTIADVIEEPSSSKPLCASPGVAI